MERLLGNSEINVLRQKGLITSAEVVYEVGGLYVAENVVDKTRRLIENAESHINEGRRVLKG